MATIQELLELKREHDRKRAKVKELEKTVTELEEELGRQKEEI